MKLISKTLLIGMISVVLSGCATKAIREECKKSAYDKCLAEYRIKDQRGQTKAEFKTCWRAGYADCCREKGVEPW